MKTVTLSVANREAVKRRALEAFSGKRRGAAVHGDVHALLAVGVLRRNADGKIEFPFDAVHVDFMLKAA